MIVHAANGKLYEEPEFMDNDALVHCFDDGYMGLCVPQKRTKTPKDCLNQFGIDGKLTYIGDTDRVFPAGDMRRCGVFHIALRKPIPLPYKHSGVVRVPCMTDYCITWKWWFQSETILKIIGGVPDEFATWFLGPRARQIILKQLSLTVGWTWNQGYFLYRSKVYTHDPVHPVGTRQAV